jgi:hypothetical protein
VRLSLAAGGSARVSCTLPMLLGRCCSAVDAKRR